MKFSIGVDPGFRETGLVLCRDAAQPEVIEWVTYSCPGGGDEPLTRAISLAGHAVDAVIDWIDRYEIEQLDISIEMPIYARNAATFTKQIRLVEEIESGLFHLAAGEVGQCYLTEIYPSTSKALLTNSGQADKDEMIRCFEKYTGQQWPVGTTKHTKETVADAYAHSLACWLEAAYLRMVRLDLTKLKGAVVEEKGRWHDGAAHR